MPRVLLFLMFLAVQFGKGLVVLKNELITGTLYFIVLAPAALVRRLRPVREKNFVARNSSWVEISAEKDTPI
jgi:hypothetical protein